MALAAFGMRRQPRGVVAVAAAVVLLACVGLIGQVGLVGSLSGSDGMAATSMHLALLAEDLRGCFGAAATEPLAEGGVSLIAVSCNRTASLGAVLLSWLARRAGDDRVRGFTANEDLFKVLLVASRMSPGGSTASEC